MEVDFYTIYAWVGIWNSIFLVLYAVLGLGSLIKFSTRSVEEIFYMFIVFCFAASALKDMVNSKLRINALNIRSIKLILFTDYSQYYFSEACSIQTLTSILESNATNITSNSTSDLALEQCQTHNSPLFLLLMVGTVWLAVTIKQFKDT